MNHHDDLDLNPQQEEEEEFPDTRPSANRKKNMIFGEFEIELILFLIVGFALRDLLQSLVKDILLPSTFNVLRVKPPKEKTWIPFRNAVPIRYGEFLEAIYGFIIIVVLVYLLVEKQFVSQSRRNLVLGEEQLAL